MPGNMLASKSEQVKLSKCVLESSKLNAFSAKWCHKEPLLQGMVKPQENWLNRKDTKGLREMS